MESYSSDAYHSEPPSVGEIIERALGTVLWLIRGVISGVATAVAVFIPVVVVIALLYPQPTLFSTPLAQVTIGTLLPQPFTADELRREESAAYQKRYEQAKALVAARAIGIQKSPSQSAELHRALAPYNADANVQHAQAEYFWLVFQGLALALVLWRLATTTSRR